MKNIKINMETFNIQSRKNFVKWGLGIISSLTILRFVGSSSKPKRQMSEGKTIKMLGEDGRLVEVEQSTLTAHRKKITDTELQNWIKR